VAEFRNTWVPGAGGRYPKPALFEMWRYEWYEEEVGRFHASEARTRIVSAPTRSSKSYAAHMDAVPECFPDWEMHDGRYMPVPVRPNDDRRVWIVGPTFSVCKEFDYIHRSLTHLAPRGLFQVVSSSNVPAQGSLEVVLSFGASKDGRPVRTVIQGKSATTPEALQGEEVDFLILSEAAEHPRKIMERYLGTRYRRGVFPTTPKAKADWLMDWMRLAETSPELGIECFSFTPRCNPGYDWPRYWQEHGMAESRVDGAVRVMPPDAQRPCSRRNGHDCFDPAVPCLAMRDAYFAEQFGGRWTFASGRVLPFRWNDDHGPSHVLDRVPAWLDDARKVVACDWGYNDPAAAGWFAIGPDGTTLLYREIYERRMDPESFVREIDERTRAAGERLDAVVGDPKKPELNLLLRKMGLPVVCRHPGAMSDRKAGHAALVKALSVDPRTGRAGLYVLSEKAGPGFGAPRIIQEWKLLRYRDGWQGDEWANAGFAGRDEGYDLTRYLLMSQFEPERRRVRMDDWARMHRAALAARPRRAAEFSFRGFAPGRVA
jgi:hypothetical protein